MTLHLSFLDFLDPQYLSKQLNKTNYYSSIASFWPAVSCPLKSLISIRISPTTNIVSVATGNNNMTVKGLDVRVSSIINHNKY